VGCRGASGREGRLRCRIPGLREAGSAYHFNNAQVPRLTSAWGDKEMATAKKLAIARSASRAHDRDGSTGLGADLAQMLTEIGPGATPEETSQKLADAARKVSGS